MRDINSSVRMGIRGGNNGTDLREKMKLQSVCADGCDSQNHTDMMGFENPV